MSSDRSAGPILDDFGLVRCALPKTAMWSERVVVHDVFVEEFFELSVVPDEGAVAEFAACGADPSFRVRVRDLWVPKTRPDMPTRCFARPDRIRRDAARLTRTYLWVPKTRPDR